MAKKKANGKKLDKKMLAKLEEVGITKVTTEEEAKAKMIAFLKKNDIDDCEDDSLEDLYEMVDRKSTRLNSSHRCISSAVFCLKKTKRLSHPSLHYQTTPFPNQTSAQ